MSDQRADRLLRLKTKLEQIDPTDLTDVRAWVAETMSIIRHDWPNFLTDFQEVSAEPQWVSYGAIAGTPDADASNARSRAVWECG